MVAGRGPWKCGMFRVHAVQRYSRFPKSTLLVVSSLDCSMVQPNRDHGFLDPALLMAIIFANQKFSKNTIRVIIQPSVPFFSI